MAIWIADLRPVERRTFAACFGGCALDAMDVQMYSFVIPAIIAAWGLTRAEAGALGTAALLVSAFGGWFAGWFADRYGREPIENAFGPKVLPSRLCGDSWICRRSAPP